LGDGSPKTFPKLAQEPLFWTSGYTAIENIGMSNSWYCHLEIAGIVAGSLKMPIAKFFPATLAGASTKDISLAFMAGILSSIPFMK